MADVDNFQAIAALVIFCLAIVFTLLLVFKTVRLTVPLPGGKRRPLVVNVRYYIAPVIAVLLMLATTAMTIQDVGRGLAGNDQIKPYGILVLFMSMAYIAASLDATGVFAWMALRFTTLSGGRGRVLFLFYFLLSSFITTFTSNDVCILTLTPIVCYFSKATGADPLPFLFAEYAAANTFGALLYTGNPTNIIVAQAYDMTFLGYSKYMTLPTLAGGAACFLMLLLEFHGSIPVTIPLPSVDASAMIRDLLGAVVGSVIMLTCLALLAAAPSLGWEMWAITLVSAGVHAVFNVWPFRNSLLHFPIWECWTCDGGRVDEGLGEGAEGVEAKGHGKLAVGEVAGGKAEAAAAAAAAVAPGAVSMAMGPRRRAGLSSSGTDAAPAPAPASDPSGCSGSGSSGTLSRLDPATPAAAAAGAAAAAAPALGSSSPAGLPGPGPRTGPVAGPVAEGTEQLEAGAVIPAPVPAASPAVSGPGVAAVVAMGGGVGGAPASASAATAAEAAAEAEAHLAAIVGAETAHAEASAAAAIAAATARTSPAVTPLSTPSTALDLGSPAKAPAGTVTSASPAGAGLGLATRPPDAAAAEAAEAGQAAGAAEPGAGATEALTADALRGKAPTYWSLVLDLPWEVVPFALGMFVLVEGLNVQGWLDVFGDGLGAASTTLPGAIFVMGALSVALANTINNQPMTILLTRVALSPSFLKHTGYGNTHKASLFALVLGSNIGAVFTVIGALAGILWSNIMQLHGRSVSYMHFARVCCPVGLATLVSSLLVLWFEFAVFPE